jgi:hypothetical protein
MHTRWPRILRPQADDTGFGRPAGCRDSSYRTFSRRRHPKRTVDYLPRARVIVGVYSNQTRKPPGPDSSNGSF